MLIAPKCITMYRVCALRVVPSIYEPVMAFNRIAVFVLCGEEDGEGGVAEDVFDALGRPMSTHLR